MIKVELKGDGHKKLRKAAKALAGTPAQKAYARALNETGKTARSKVERAVAKQMGVKTATIGKRSSISTSAAIPERLNYTIRANGGALSFKDHGSVQTGEGVASSPWGRGHLFKGAFIGARPGMTTRALGGHTFHRTGEVRVMKKGSYKGQKREVIDRMHGPALPKEIVKDASKDVFETYTAERLPKRVAHQIKRATGGAFG